MFIRAAGIVGSAGVFTHKYIRCRNSVQLQLLPAIYFRRAGPSGRRLRLPCFDESQGQMVSGANNGFVATSESWLLCRNRSRVGQRLRLGQDLRRMNHAGR